MKMSMRILATIKKCLTLAIKSKYYDKSTKLVVAKIKDDTAGVAMKNLLGHIWWTIIVSIKKTKGVNRNVVARISHDKYKDVLLNKKCLRHSMNRIQSKDHKIETYETNKISLA